MEAAHSGGAYTTFRDMLSLYFDVGLMHSPPPRCNRHASPRDGSGAPRLAAGGVNTQLLEDLSTIAWKAVLRTRLTEAASFSTGLYRSIWDLREAELFELLNARLQFIGTRCR